MMSKADFLAQDKKAITLMGMSGVGKTVLSMKMEAWGWQHFSCDLEIGRTALGGEITRVMGVPSSTITADDLSLLSRYVGQVGNTDEGGLDIVEFKRRQRAYLNAEREAMSKACDLMDSRTMPFIHDSTGSMCELNDNALMRNIAERSLIIYIQADEQDTQDILERARLYPKPLYFPSDLFDTWLREYMQGQGITDYNAVAPDDFSRWVFPMLFDSRLPKYKRLADRYGITIMSKTMAEIEEEEDLYAVIEDHL